MPGPLVSQVHQAKFTTNMSIAYMQKSTSYVWRQAFPICPVNNISGTFPIFSQGDFLRDNVRRVAPGSTYPRFGYDISAGTYSCVKWGLEHPIPIEVINNADEPIRPEEAGAAWLAQQFDIHMEAQWAAGYFVTGKWTRETTPSNLWDNYTTSAPLTDILVTGRKQFIKDNAVVPNIFVANLDVDAALKNHPDVLARYKVTNADSISNDMMARLLQVEKYLVSEAVYESADKGATSSITTICGKNAAYFYAPLVPSIMTPSSGYSFTWKGGTGNSYGVNVDRYWEPQSKSWVLQGDIYADVKLCAAGMAYFWLAAVS